MGYRPSYAKHIRKTGPKDLALTEFSSAMLSLIANRAATSRADLARQLNLAPSTITLRVNELIDAGLITESGAGGHTGGRRCCAWSPTPVASWPPIWARPTPGSAG